MKLLIEQTEDVKFLKENINGKKDYYIKGIFIQGQVKNRNGRIYPIDVLSEAVKKYDDDYIQKKRALSELDHPESPTINLDRVSHIITELKQNGSNFIGKAKIMSTPMGNIAKNLIDEGVLLGVSSRALGSLTESHDGTKIVGPDLIIAAIDIVSNPSAPEAFVESLNESTEWVMQAGKWVPKFMDKIAKPALNNMNGQKAQDVAAKLFEEFLNSIGKK